jgi:pteridine reductase
MTLRALITGGTGKLGEPVAARLRNEGWQVLAAGRADGDLRRPAEARALVERAAAELGGLDVLVCGAADGFEPRPVESVTEADWDNALDVNAKGTFFVAQAAAPHLRSSRGLLVLVEDVAAEQGWPSFVPHAAAKGAVGALRRSLARALAPEVRVNGVAPGNVAVEPGQEQRRAAESLLGTVGTPEDVAEAILYLARARFVTGTSLVVDGGRLLQTERRGSP